MRTNDEQAFNKAMVDIYHRAKDEAGYKASRYIQMVLDIGGVEAAKTLINSDTPSDGYTELWRLGRLDITVEALVVENEKWHGLFLPEEVDRAKNKLLEYDYEPQDRS